MRLLLLPLLALTTAPAFAQSMNVTRLGLLDPRPEGYADVWGYVGANGREYALINARSGGGVSVIDVTEMPPVEIDFIPGSGSGSDVEVYTDYAYVSDDFGSTQIVDLTDPTNPALVNTFGGSVHTLTVAGDYLYTNGGSGNGVLIWSLADPVDPQFVGEYQPGYVHDIHVRNDTLYAARIYGEGVDIVDVSDKANPAFIDTFNYPDSGAHNVCSTASGSYIYVGDEIGGGPWTRIFDVRDPHNVELVGEIIVDAGSIVHNCHVKDGLLYLAHYGRGAHVFDISDPVNPVEVAFYEDNVELMWSVYPHLPSGKIIASDMGTGLHVLQLEGVVASEGGPAASGFALLPVTPNPVEGTATLRVSLDRAVSDARLAVYDALGRPVAVLHDGALPAGPHAMRFDAARLPSGVYLARLEAGGRLAAQRLTVLR